VPTTHIIKPAVTGLDDHDLNEHICLSAARELDIDAAPTEIVSFAGERAIVVTRYDRLRLPDGSVRRVHQEDLCQALGVPPDGKYQNEGGPSPERILELLRRFTATTMGDVTVRFLDALAFNWLIAGTDAHAKNYSILLSGPGVRLAPLYDVSSALPYDDLYLPELKLAMRIGGEYGVTKIQGRHWRRLAEATGLDPDEVVHRIGRIAAYLPAAFAEAVHSGPVAAVGGDLPERLLQRVTARASRCQDELAVS
jgi:serine/threonine-protein kinase HipA